MLLIAFVSTNSRREAAKIIHWTSCCPSTTDHATVNLVYHIDRLSVARGRFDGLDVSRRWGYLDEFWAADACTTVTRAAADILRYLPLRDPTATEIGRQMTVERR